MFLIYCTNFYFALMKNILTTRYRCNTHVNKVFSINCSFFFPDWLKADEVRDMILEGGADCVLLHKKGLYVAGQVSSTVNFILYASIKFCDFVVLCHIARIIIIASVEIKRGVIKSVGVDCLSWLYEDKCSSHLYMNLQMVFTLSSKSKNYQWKIITLYIFARQVRLKINSFALPWRRGEIA